MKHADVCLYNCGDTHMTVHLPLVTSLAQSISVSSLIIRPFSGLQRAKLITQATSAISAITLPSSIQSTVLPHSSPTSISVSLVTALSALTMLTRQASQATLGGRYGVKPCASPAGMRTECAAGSLNWNILSASMVSISVS